MHQERKLGGSCCACCISSFMKVQCVVFFFFVVVFFMDVILTRGLLLEKSLHEGCSAACCDPHGLRAAVCRVCCCCPRSSQGSLKFSPKKETHAFAPGSSVYYTSEQSLQEVKASSIIEERSCFLKADS